MRRSLLFLLLAAAPASAQQRACPPGDDACATIAALASHDAVSAALEFIVTDDERTMRDLVALTQIPAPPFGEEARGAAFADYLRAAGADSVWTDSVGNVIGLRRGTPGGRTFAISGHLDTVFPAETDVTVKTRGDTLYAPGIADDARGLVAVLALLRALETAGIETEMDVLFIGTVGEEGLGDLRGVKHLFRAGGPRIDAFISIDGTGDDFVTHMALGSRRYRATFRGPGGHSWGGFGIANPAHALGRAVARFDAAAASLIRNMPRTSYNVGRIGGGTSVNAIPFEVWMEVDMRSESPDALMRIDSLFHAEMHAGVAEENDGAARGDPVSVELELVGDRPSGDVAANAPIVRHAAAAARFFAMEPVLRRSSTDANVPISLGIPAITIGAGGESGPTHSPDEWYRNVNGPRGIQRALLVLLAQAGMAGQNTTPSSQ